jgi:spore coat polysaccharide biosynthesis predicted glycosyltransferase SpsG
VDDAIRRHEAVPAMSRRALLVADAGPEDGLGHLSRASAIAVALRCRGIETFCHAHGAAGPLERESVEWIPWSRDSALPTDVDVVVFDSYRLEPDTAIGASAPVVAFADANDIVSEAPLVVSVAAEPSDDPPLLAGPRYAALTPSYWGLPPKPAREGPPRHVLVTTGGGGTVDNGVAVAQAVAAKLPDAEVTLVRGPYDSPSNVAGIRVVNAPSSLFEEQLAADLVICGGGQTMLESAACGTPCLVLILADNQRAQARSLAAHGAVVLAEPQNAESVAAAVASLDAEARDELSRCAQRVVDGYGALRIAFHIDVLVRRPA